MTIDNDALCIHRELLEYMALNTPILLITFNRPDHTRKVLEKQWWNGSEEELKKVGEMEFRVGERMSED